MDADVSDRNRLERLRYRQGQTLLGRDFRDQGLIAAQLRWWHNRAMHRAYGVAPGILEELHVKQDDPSAKTATVLPGLAYDVFGRELILAQPRTVPIPKEGDYTLLARFAAPGDPKGWDDLAGVCAPGRPPSALAELDLIWEPSDGITPRDGVPLATCTGGTATPVAPPLARPLARPHIVTGSTIPGATDWQNWTPTPAATRRGAAAALGIQVDIDTSAAGFTATPCYFAWLGGPAWGPAVSLGVMLFFGHVGAESYDGFRFRVLMGLSPLAGAIPRSVMGSSVDLVRVARDLQLYVFWFGIQPVTPGRDCPADSQTTAQGAPLQ